MKFYDRINELSILQENEQQSYNSAFLIPTPIKIDVSRIKKFIKNV